MLVVGAFLLDRLRRVKRLLAPWLRPVKKLLADRLRLARAFFASRFSRRPQASSVLCQPGWIDRTLLSDGISDKQFLLTHAIQALRCGDSQNALNILLNLSRIHPDVLAESLATLDSLWRRERRISFVKSCCDSLVRLGSPEKGRNRENSCRRLLGILLGHKSQGDENHLREELISSDPYVAFAARCLLINLMLGQGREEEAFEAFKCSWPLRCVEPYLSLIVAQRPDLPHPSRGFRPCCPYLEPTASCEVESPIDFLQVWNSLAFAHSRMDVHRPSASGGGCRSCFMQGVYGEDYLIGSHSATLEDPSPLQLENLASVRKHFLRGDVLLRSYPVMLSLNLGLSCNLRCIMCSAKWSKYSKEYDFSQEQVASVLPLLPYAGCLNLSGGEPLVYSTTKYLVEYITAHPEINDHLVVSFGTNGTLLERSLEWLSGLKRVEVWVSLDSLGSAYEHIRGGSWEQVQRNVLAFNERVEASGGRWKIFTANILMKSSLASLRELVLWHCKHAISSMYYKVLLYGDDPLIPQEDLIACPSLLQDIPDWREILDDSIQLLRGAGDGRGATSLEHFCKELKARVTAECLV